MSIVWLVPVAIWGLVALAVPILVHLLTRQERRPITFPSLRFLSATRLVAMRRRRIHDWILLAVRAATIATAVAALAGPLLLSAGRERAWGERTARAIVVLDGAQAPGEETGTAFSSHVVAAEARAAEGLRSAIEWLGTQPPAARELLIVGDLRADAIDEADLSRVPSHVGIRFLPITDATPQSQVTQPVMTLRDGRVALDERRVHLNANDTTIEPGSRAGALPTTTPRLEMRAAPEDQRAADAALTALLAEGVFVDVPSARHIIVVWPGASEPTAADNAVVVHAPTKPSGAAAVHVLRKVVARVLDDPATPREPERITAAALARWSRAPGAVPRDAVKQDEGDRRVIWGVVLVLLGLEWMIRRADRSKPSLEASPIEEPIVGQSLGEGGRVA